MDKKVVLITGGSSGLGKSLAYKYAENNYNLILTYLTNEKEALIIKKDLEEKYSIECMIIQCDLSKEEDIKYLYEKSIKKFEKIDVLINNAAISYDTEFDSKIKPIFMRILEVNLVGTFTLTKVIGNTMYKNKSGKIINIASTNGIDSYYEYSLDYDASKAALINLTHNIANHYAPFINVNCVCPGWINTPMNEKMDPEFREKEEEKILLQRFAEPREIANLVFFLTSEDASYINDSIIKIDGGVKK